MRGIPQFITFWNVREAPGERRNGNDKQNVSLRYLFNIPLLTVRWVLKAREGSSSWAMAPLVVCERGRRWVLFRCCSAGFKVIRLDQKRFCSKVLLSWSVFSSFFLPCIFPPPHPLKDYPGFQLNQSCLWLEIMSVARWASNEHRSSRAPPARLQSHHADTFADGRKREIPAFRDQLKTHIQIEGAQ